MKKIICYGDSNTFGYNPEDVSRYDENTRWTGVLQKKLGTEYEVINEGMCDRTGFVNNPKGFLYSAPKHFPELMSKSENIDILILWIGTNDLQSQYNISIDTVEKGLEKLINIAKKKTSNIIIVPPVILSNKILEGAFSYQFDETSIVKSREAEKMFKTISNIYHCKYFDVNKIVYPSNFDGLHYDKESHIIIGNNLSDFINNYKKL